MNDMDIQDIEDTIGKLDDVIELGTMSSTKWANSAKEVVEGIRDRAENYRGILTDNQARAVQNIDNKAQEILDGN